MVSVFVCMFANARACKPFLLCPAQVYARQKGKLFFCIVNCSSLKHISMRDTNVYGYSRQKKMIFAIILLLLLLLLPPQLQIELRYAI